MCCSGAEFLSPVATQDVDVLGKASFTTRKKHQIWYKHHAHYRFSFKHFVMQTVSYDYCLFIGEIDHQKFKNPYKTESR